MSVIIEGLTLPKHNPKEIDKNVLIGYAIVKEDNTAELCLEGVRYLIKMLPTPHGDLIDKEPIKEFILDGINKLSPESYGYDGIEILSEIEFAPVIIEAEVSE